MDRWDKLYISKRKTINWVWVRGNNEIIKEMLKD